MPKPKIKAKIKKVSPLEEMLAFQMKAAKLPEFVRSYHFASVHVGEGKGVRKRLKEAGLKNWASDFAFIEQKIIVEIEGGGWLKIGGHTSGTGFADDLIKYDAAMSQGWVVYRCDGAMVKNGMALRTIEILLDMRIAAY